MYTTRRASELRRQASYQNHGGAVLSEGIGSSRRTPWVGKWCNGYDISHLGAFFAYPHVPHLVSPFLC